jgi:hypothetical protein
VTRLAVSAVAFAAALGLGLGGSPPAVTLSVLPTIAPAYRTVTLSGTIGNPKAGELVTVQGKECGVAGSFRALAAAQTTAGGGWSVDYMPRAMTVFRASWGGAVSTEVTVRVRAFVAIYPRTGNRFRVAVSTVGRLDRKRVAIERFDRGASKWRSVQTVVVSSGAYGEYADKVVRIAVPKGTTVRAVLPLSQAKPCYLAGYSKLIRT